MAITSLKAIRLQCLECVGTSQEVAKCTNARCSLFPFRFGHRPTAGDMAAHMAALPPKPQRQQRPANQAGLAALKKFRDERMRLKCERGGGME